MTYDDRTSRNDGRVQEPDRTAKQWNATIHQELFLSKHPSNEPQRPIVQNAGIALDKTTKAVYSVSILNLITQFLNKFRARGSEKNYHCCRSPKRQNQCVHQATANVH